MWFVTKSFLSKFWKSESSKIKDSIEGIREGVVSKKEIELMIREAILQVREVSPRNPRTKTRTKLRKKADKFLDKAEILNEMRLLLDNQHTTTEIFDIIVREKELIKKTCFFKYLKEINNSPHEVREQIKTTPRTNRFTE